MSQSNRFAIVQREGYDQIIQAGCSEVFPTYIAMAMHTFGSGECTMSLSTIEEWTKCSRRTICDHLKKLESAEIIEIIGTKRDDGGNGINRYRLISWKLYSALDCIGVSEVDDTTPSEVDDTSNIKGLKTKSNNIQGHIAQSNVKTPRFRKPTVEEVIAYFRELRASDPDEVGTAWFDYKEGSGWKTKTGPVVDWKACCRTHRRFEIEAGRWEEARIKAPEPELDVHYKLKTTKGQHTPWCLDDSGPFNKVEWKKQWLIEKGLVKA